MPALPIRAGLDAPQTWASFKAWLIQLYDYTADFDQRYYGALSADPVTNPLGGAILEGDLYYRTAAPKGMMVWRGDAWINYEQSAVSAAVAASANAAAALASASNAAASEVAAEAAKVASQDAAAASYISADVYDSIEMGLAGTVEGEQFQFNSSDGLSSQRYLHAAGHVATAVGAPFPLLSALAGVVAEFAHFPGADDPAWVIRDNLSKIAAYLSKAGLFTAKLDPATMGAGLTQYASLYDAVLVVVDTVGNIGATLTKAGALTGDIQAAETIAARGERTTLDARLSEHLTDYGLPKQLLWGEWYLRETRQRLRSIERGDAERLVIASVGDSWTWDTYWSDSVIKKLISQYGNGGSGWTGFAGGSNGVNTNGNVDVSKVTVLQSGTWSYAAYNTSTSPDIGQISSSTAGALVAVTGQAGTSGIDLFYIGDATGAVRYRWDGGAWAALSLTGSGLQIVALTGAPATAFTLEIEVVTGAVKLCGINIKSTATGVMLHKLGSNGSRAGHWAAVDAAQWQSGLTALAPNLVTLLLGTNDQAANVTVASYAADLQTQITRIRAAVPFVDILLMAACECKTAPTYAMSLYAESAYQIAAQNKCGFLNLQYAFGDAVTEYNSASTRAWVEADDTHPSAKGKRAIQDAIIYAITKN